MRVCARTFHYRLFQVIRKCYYTFTQYLRESYRAHTRVCVVVFLYKHLCETEMEKEFLKMEIKWRKLILEAVVAPTSNLYELCKCTRLLIDNCGTVHHLYQPTSSSSFR